VRRRSRRVARALALAAGLAAPAPAQFVSPEGSDFHNGSSILLQDQGAARELLDELETAIAVADARQARGLYALLRSGPRDAMVELGPRTHVPAIDRAARLVGGSGREEVLAEVEAFERHAIEAARRERDLDALIDRATTAPALPSSRVAGLLALRLLLERGERFEAEAIATRLLDGEADDEVAAAARALVEAHRRPPPPPPPTAQARPGGLRRTGQLARPVDRGSRGARPWLDRYADDDLLVLDRRGIARLDMPTGDVVAEHRWGRGPEGSRPLEPHAFTAARGGDLVVLPYNVRLRFAMLAKSTPHTRRAARLVAFDVRRWGHAWIAEVDDPDGVSTAFGAPRIVDGRVWVQLFSVDATTRVSLRCYELATGRLVHDVPLVEGAQVDRYGKRTALLRDDVEPDRRAREGPPAVRAGVVYASTGFGVVAAVDALTGRLLHTFRYDRMFSVEEGVYHPTYLFDTGGWEHEPVRVFGDRVVVAPSDARYLYVLDERPGPGGHLVLDDPLERLDRLGVVALLPDPDASPSPAVLFSRRRDNRVGLSLVEPDGHVLVHAPRLPPDRELLGRPARVGEAVLVPTSGGVFAWDVDDLDRPPRRLRVPRGNPPVRHLHDLGDVVVGSSVALLELWRPDGP